MITNGVTDIVPRLKNQGINLAFANLLLQHNCNVVFADLGLRLEAQATIDKHQTGSPRAVFVQTDVTIWDQLENMFVVAEKEFGQVDIVRLILPAPS